MRSNQVDSGGRTRELLRSFQRISFYFLDPPSILECDVRLRRGKGEGRGRGEGEITHVCTSELKRVQADIREDVHESFGYFPLVPTQQSLPAL